MSAADDRVKAFADQVVAALSTIADRTKNISDDVDDLIKNGAGTGDLDPAVAQRLTDISASLGVTADALTVIAAKHDTPAGGGGTGGNVSVSILQPTAQVISGSTVFSASALAPNSSIAGVQFSVDGAPMGAEILVAPYTLPWDSTSVADGPHTVSVTARDATGQSISASVAVTVANAASARPFVSRRAGAPRK